MVQHVGTESKQGPAVTKEGLTDKMAINIRIGHAHTRT